ncbi:MAG: PqqD family protein [Myxococcales bacterium]|jgi:hypothetical protein
MGLRRIDGVETEELPSGETVVFHPESGVAVVLNPMGGVVWGLCDGRRSAAEIADFICRNVEGAPGDKEVSGDVDALIGQLKERGLVEESEACGPGSSTP